MGTSKLAVVAFGLCAVLGGASAARADPKALSATYTNCMDNSSGATADMIDCMAAEHEKQDKRLNAAYKAAMKSFEGKRAQDLKEVQRAWLKYRDLNCGFLAGGEGTIARIEGNGCMLSMTAERADALQALAEAAQ